MEARVAVLEQIAKDTRDALGDMREMMLRMDAKMDAGFAKLDAKIDGLDAKFDGKFEGIRDRQERDFRLVVAMLIAAVLGLAAPMAHEFKWIP